MSGLRSMVTDFLEGFGPGGPTRVEEGEVFTEPQVGAYINRCIVENAQRAYRRMRNESRIYPLIDVDLNNMEAVARAAALIKSNPEVSQFVRNWVAWESSAASNSWRLVCARVAEEHREIDPLLIQTLRSFATRHMSEEEIFVQLSAAMLELLKNSSSPALREQYQELVGSGEAHLHGA